MENEVKITEAENLIAEEINLEIKKILAKFPQFALGAQPLIMPNGTIGARPLLVKVNPEQKPEKASEIAKP